MLLSIPILNKKIQEYQRRQRYSKIVGEIGLLYQMAPSPYQLAKQNRDYFPDNTTYGAVEIPTLLDLIADCHLSNAVFYDLGSGDGKSLLAVKLAHPHFIVRGIEIIPDLFELSKTQYHRYLEQHALSETQFKIDYIHDDFLKTNWNDATLIFLNATGFNAPFWEKVVSKLITLPPQTKVIVTSKTLPCPPFHLISQGMEKMSWGLTATMIYEKTN